MAIERRHRFRLLVCHIAKRERRHVLMRRIDGHDSRGGVIIGKTGMEMTKSFAFDEHPDENQEENQEGQNQRNNQEKQVVIDVFEEVHDLFPDAFQDDDGGRVAHNSKYFTTFASALHANFRLVGVGAKLYDSRTGEVPKRLKGSVSKTDSGCKPSRGSNPRFSANETKRGAKTLFFLCRSPFFGKMKP